MYIKLPKHIEAAQVENLVTALAKAIQDWLTDSMEACNLQPTSRAARLAAEAAVCVLIAHEIGQEVGEEVGDTTQRVASDAASFPSGGNNE